MQLNATNSELPCNYMQLNPPKETLMLTGSFHYFTPKQRGPGDWLGMLVDGFATTTTSMPQHLVSNNIKSGSSREPGPTGQEDDRERGYGQKKEAEGGGGGGGRDAPAVPAE